VPLASLYEDDGIDYLAERFDELVTALLVPSAADAGRCRSAFWGVRPPGWIRGSRRRGIGLCRMVPS
jgi:hypothetical protein